MSSPSTRTEWGPYFYILECGKIYSIREQDGEGQGQLRIQNIDDLYTKVKPFFKKYPLRAKKRFDFKLWCDALWIFYIAISRRGDGVQELMISL